MSHQVTVKTEFTDKGALGDAVREMGGDVLGEGAVRQYQSNAVGFGFTLPGWRFPLCLEESGNLKFDDYNGSWGNRADVDRLKERYTIFLAERAATEMGWMTTREENGDLTVFVGDASLTITPAGVIDACGFMGTGCDAAVNAMSAALGSEQSRQVKPEYRLSQVEMKQL